MKFTACELADSKYNPAMRRTIPHPIPYQGSKRRLAPAILAHVDDGAYQRLVEPFAGSASTTLAAAAQRKFSSFVIGDALGPLIELWNQILKNPLAVAANYEQLWDREQQSSIATYYAIRTEFNQFPDPSRLLYLLARCVKNAVRFNPSGKFNQSPDKRRRGTDPQRMRQHLLAAHHLLAGRTEAVHGDFMELLDAARPGDFFYLDPPYQGTSNGRDKRYISGVTREEIVAGLTKLNQMNIPFVLSYDGSCGDRVYGEPLPAEIAQHVTLAVGRSSQATLSGRTESTVESLYISHRMPLGSGVRAFSLDDFSPRQLSLA